MQKIIYKSFLLLKEFKKFRVLKLYLKTGLLLRICFKIFFVIYLGSVGRSHLPCIEETDADKGAVSYTHLDVYKRQKERRLR